jgi:hypothetical protein
MKEFSKAKKQLDDYTSGVRKSKPGKAMLDILESQGVISKIEDEIKGAGKKMGKSRESRRLRNGPILVTTRYEKVLILLLMVTKNIKRQRIQ